MKNVYEILEEFKKAPTKQDKINILRKNIRENALADVLRGAYDPRVKFVFKEKIEWKNSLSPPGMGYTSLAVEFPRMYLFIENHPKTDKNLPQRRKYEIALQVLESLENKEAEVLMNMFLKDLKVPDLNREFINEALPGLIPR